MTEIKRIKPPFLSHLILRILLRGAEYFEFSEDIREVYQQLIECGPKWRAKAWFSIRVIESVPSLIKDIFYWRFLMITNYFKIALRNFQRHKGYSLINIAGFATGMACCLLILIYVRHETSYDKYHKDVDRVYRIAQDIRTKTANRAFAPISPMVAPTLKADFPQVEHAARILIARNRLVKRGDVFFYEDRFMWADQELFDVITIPFIKGYPAEALTRPQTVVITERMSQKYFGHADPLGEILQINQRDYEVTGVVANSPKNTHIKYDLIASLETLADWDEMTNWYSTMFFTYLKLYPNVNVEEFAQQASRLADKYVGAQLKNWGSVYHYFLQPISSIHLHSHIRYDIEPSGNRLYVYIFAFVGLFILLIASLNFMNLSTARSASRAKEVGLRKVVGAQKRQLIGQFLGESLFIGLLALGLALLVAWLVIPFINSITGISLNFTELLKPVVFIALIAGTVFVGLAAGLYPAFVLSAFRPAATLKGAMSSGSRGYALRNVLVVVQFAISVFLIFGTLVMFRQFNFMKNQHLGFDKEQKLVLPLRGGIDIQENFRMVKDMFSKNPSVSGVTVSSTVPGRGVSSFGVALIGEEDDKNQSMYHMYFDPDFIPDYGIEIIAGRSFQEQISTDFMGAFLINEAAVKAFGWASPEEALGKRFRTGHGGRINPIIGVTKDFHYRGLQTGVEPLVMEYLPWTYRYVTLSIDTSNLKETMAFVESQWKTLFPENPFESFFLDTDFDRQYRTDEQIGTIFSIFTVLGLFIACLGLFGLASFSAERRTKEIGIRKVLGASVPGIVVLLSKQFTKWVIIANCIAWPLAYYFMFKWLKNFAYSARIDILTFIFSGLIVLFIALVTVSLQTVRAATANPVDSLRYE
ncbi:MAG: ABC transporter permease [Candidatus Aminicenantes bacterium]|jgi:putative ABC transport system permease protein